MRHGHGRTRVRPAGARDLPGIRSLAAATWPEFVPIPCAASLTPEGMGSLAAARVAAGCPCTVAVAAGGRVVGFCYAFDAARCPADQPVAEGTFFLNYLAVDPAFRGRGLGRRLAARCLALASAAGGYSRAEATTWSGNEASLRLQASLGMAECGRVRGERPGGRDTVVSAAGMPWRDPRRPRREG